MVVLKIGPLILTALFAAHMGAAERVATEKASGDCGKQVAAKRSHRWNPAKLPQKIEHKFSDFALSVSSIGIEQPAPVCLTAERLCNGGSLKAQTAVRNKANSDTVTPGL